MARGRKKNHRSSHRPPRAKCCKTKAAAGERSLSRQPFCAAGLGKNTQHRANPCRAPATAPPLPTPSPPGSCSVCKGARGARASQRAHRRVVRTSPCLFLSLSRDIVVRIIEFRRQTALVVHALLCSKTERKKGVWRFGAEIASLSKRFAFLSKTGSGRAMRTILPTQARDTSIAIFKGRN
eukprot:COSAG06_NODE_15406_length_1072_cov_30.750257_1_plen_181_part_00